MPEISFEDLVTGLRGWARGQTAHEQAAVELLIWHESWLRRPDFKGACIRQLAPGLVAIVNWDEAEEFVRFYTPRGQSRALPASTSQRRVLDAVVALGANQLGLAGLGRVHKRKVAEAFAAALGQELTPAVPQHNHPDFIPGDSTCEVCVQAAAAEGSRSDA